MASSKNKGEDRTQSRHNYQVTDDVSSPDENKSRWGWVVGVCASLGILLWALSEGVKDIHPTLSHWLLFFALLFFLVDVLAVPQRYLGGAWGWYVIPYTVGGILCAWALNMNSYMSAFVYLVSSAIQSATRSATQSATQPSIQAFVLRELPWLLMIFFGAFILFCLWCALRAHEQDSPAIRRAKDIKMSGTPTPKVFPNIAPGTLPGYYKQHMPLQAKSLIEPYMGKWMKVRGKVRSVDKDSYSGGFDIWLEECDSERTAVNLLCKSSWAARIQTLQKGEEITAIGQIRYVSEGAVGLTYCEILS